ncbi:hypothetical protein [Tsukamurella tyrosinosolvens]|uniref:hypothetical protein n=1 Tax=Tsukamurella tyrosinosolvens TaxID=57704 RepID=UPI0034635082
MTVLLTQTTRQGQAPPETHDGCVLAGHQLPDDQASNDPQDSFVVGDPTSTGAGQGCLDAQTPSTRPGGFLRDPVLGLLADVLDDFETVRIANANRVRQLTRTETDSDGEERGFGLSEDNLVVRKLLGTVAALEQAEHEAVLNLQRTMRAHPLTAYQKRHKGIGEKQLARLLAAIGDPYWNDLHERPRTVSELWAYCGFDVRNGAAPKRTRGQVSNWSENARKRVWVIASAMPKFPGGTYEVTYRNARIKYEGSVHPLDCIRCGPAGKPAPAGTPRSDGHNHAMAIRLVAKEILRDLWVASKDIYETGSTR